MEEMMMNVNGKSSCVLGIFLFLLVGALMTPAYGESPIIITPFQWYTGVTDLGGSKSASFTVQNGGAVPLVIRNIRLRTTSSCDTTSCNARSIWRDARGNYFHGRSRRSPQSLHRG